MKIDNDIKYSYFDWMVKLISPNNSIEYINHYTKLLQTLNLFDYMPQREMDKNRLLDGLLLRDRFSDEANLDRMDVNYYINEPCSLLEMMVALAFRCEDTIMYDASKGDRTYIWFQAMLESLNLYEQTNDRFDDDYVRHRISIFLNGQTSLFSVTTSDIDMTNYDIWYQMQAFLREYDRHENCKRIIITSLK